MWSNQFGYRAQGMPTVFRTSRLARGSTMFPLLVVLEERGLRTARLRWIGRAEQFISYDSIGSVAVNEGAVFAVLEISLTGAPTPMVVNGLRRRDARMLARALVARLR